MENIKYQVFMEKKWLLFILSLFNKYKVTPISFVENSTAHLLKKNSRIYDLAVQRYVQNTRCCNNYSASVSYSVCFQRSVIFNKQSIFSSTVLSENSYEWIYLRARHDCDKKIKSSGSSSSRSHCHRLSSFHLLSPTHKCSSCENFFFILQTESYLIAKVLRWFIVND